MDWESGGVLGSCPECGLANVAPATACPCGHAFDKVPIAANHAPASVPDSSEAVGNPPPSHNYVARHWQRALSLGKSYWLNGVLANIALRPLLAMGARTFADVDAAYARAASMVAIWMLGVSISTWQSVGIWRSANRSKTRAWSLAAKVCVCVWIIGALAQFGVRGLPMLWGAFSQARWLSANGTATFRVLAGGTEVEASGGIGHGFAQALKNELDQLPAVRLVRVNLDVGGLMEEAKQARVLIASRGLSTEVSGACVSACTIVFLGGSRRVLRSGGLLGFHPPRVPGDGALSRSNLAGELRYLADLGVTWDFAEHVVAVPIDSMWYPSIQQLTDAGVVTRVVFSTDDPPGSESDATLAGPGIENAPARRPQKINAFLSLLGGAWPSLHIDARRPGVVVPSTLRSEAHLVLEYGLDLPIPIPDMEVNEHEIRATLSFSGHQEMTVIPWNAVYAVTISSGGERGVIYDEDVPADVSLTLRSRRAGHRR